MRETDKIAVYGSSVPLGILTLKDAERLKEMYGDLLQIIDPTK